MITIFADEEYKNLIDLSAQEKKNEICFIADLLIEQNVRIKKLGENYDIDRFMDHVEDHGGYKKTIKMNLLNDEFNTADIHSFYYSMARDYISNIIFEVDFDHIDSLD